MCPERPTNDGTFPFSEQFGTIHAFWEPLSALYTFGFCIPIQNGVSLLHTQGITLRLATGRSAFVGREESEMGMCQEMRRQSASRRIASAGTAAALFAAISMCMLPSARAFGGVALGKVSLRNGVSSSAARADSPRGLSSVKMQRLFSFETKPEPTKTKDITEQLLSGESPSQFWLNPFPLKPYVPSRETVAKEVAPNVFTFEQVHGFANVSVNIRMTVVKLSDGGLWVHAPIAPTEECLAMVRNLGEVKHILLPTTGLEHKTFMGPFVQKFPEAQVWVAPGQWSWPIDLPLGFKVDGILKDQDATTPWAKEIEQKVVYAQVGIGKCSEVAFFHKKTQSLLVTDAVIYISKDAPEVLSAMAEEENKWQKSALMACFLGPPYVPSFDEISDKIFVSPVVRTFIYERTRDETLEWVESICKWNFKQIIPAHLDAPIRAGPKQFKEAFKFLSDPAENPLPEGDMKPLNAISKLLSLTGLVPPRAFGEV